MSYSSQGISIKNVLSPGEDEDSQYSYPLASQNMYQKPDDKKCCYEFCVKKECCNNKYLKCTSFHPLQKKDQMTCCWFIIMISSLLIAIIGTLVLYDFADQAINTEVVIDSTDSPNYEAWQTNAYGAGTDLQITFDLYLFDVQNSQDIINGARPVVVEVGPYAFQEYYNKFDIEWADDGDTVTYNTQKYYIFDESRTDPGLSLTDNITVPYASAIGFQYLVSTLSQNLTAILDLYIYEEIELSYQSIESQLASLYRKVSIIPKILLPNKAAILSEITNSEVAVTNFYAGLLQFVNESNPVDLIFKTIMCGGPNGVSPFWVVNPFDAWFGWLKDPILTEVQHIIDVLVAQSPNITSIPWTSAVPGSTTNWSSIEDVRRRRAPDTFKTGKKNLNQVSQFVKYSNMTSNWACVAPMDSQNTSQYVEGEQFPACALFQTEWTAEEATTAGYQLPFGTDYANRIAGSDANMYGRPVRSAKQLVFISDIYRAAYLELTGIQDWYGVPVRRYQIQNKDLYNSSLNPENLQYFNYDGPSGMENLTKAVNVPVWLSFPHFLDGDNRLVSAVKGIQPNKEKHESYLDVEPQTGLLTRAKKRLQVNYYMGNQYFPTAPPGSLQTAEIICSNISRLIDSLIAAGLADNITSINCSLTIITPLLKCFTYPVNWIYQNNGIYFPYGWADEAVALPGSDANDLNDSLLVIDDIADELQFWCLMIAAFAFTVIVVMVWNRPITVNDSTDPYVKGGQYSLLSDGNENVTLSTPSKRDLSFHSE